MSRQSRTQRFKEAVIATFCEPADIAVDQLSIFNEQDWRRSLMWLDASGLALYLLDRLVALGREEVVPAGVFRRLQQNLADNRVRTEALLGETIEINLCFRQANITFANLKGISLSPESVHDPALRCQLDMDFLVDSTHGTAARHVLEKMGYVLDAISGDTWEFKAGASELPSIRDLYRSKPQRSVELHLSHSHVTPGMPSDGQLDRLIFRSFCGESLAVLSPADLFLSQALHLYKHVCSSFTRISWLLEYRRHVIARYDDAAFWVTVQQCAEKHPHSASAIGIVTFLTTEIFGNFAPVDLWRWTADQLSPGIRLWVDAYWRRALFADFPGTKLYLLLQGQLVTRENEEKRELRRHLIPLRSPRMISHGHTGEQLAFRLKRYRTQVRYVLFRLRFHVLEGIRYTLEFPRWHWRMTGLRN